ncbi:MAG TPA: ABC transporter permease [Gemmataceae bacterium]|nr:ABC transporter permease [Gemmataceae bacterium]
MHLEALLVYMNAPYSLRMLWRDRSRFLPALLAVGLSAILIAVQCGLVAGLVCCTSALIDQTSADIWVLPLEAPSVHQTSGFPLEWQARLDLQPEVDRSENFLTAMGRWRRPGRGSTDLCMIIGVRLDDASLGAPKVLTPELRAALAEPGTVAIDAWELSTLGLNGSGYEAGEINGQPVRLVGTLRGFSGFSFVYVYCSHETLQMLAPQVVEYPDVATCLVAHCRDPRDVGRVVARLRRDYPDMGVYSSSELSTQARFYWLFRSRGGMVMISTMVLAVLVGLSVTSETLYAAVLAQAKEFAVLEALGIPHRHARGLVLAQSFWIGVGGVIMALPCIVALAWAGLWIHTTIILSAPILLITFALTLGMAIFAGFVSLRPLRSIEPAKLLR